MNTRYQLAVFLLNEQQYALRIQSVERVIRAAAVTPLPAAPGIVMGIINIEGRIIPVINIRRRFGHPEREIDLWDRFIIAQTPRRTVALIVDAVSRIAEYDASDVVSSERIVPGMTHIDAVVTLEDGLILIQDLDRLLSLEEDDRLSQALHQQVESDHDLRDSNRRSFKTQ